MKPSPDSDTAPPAREPPPFGEAGVFSGRGIMLGSNPDVWDQALGLAKDGFLEVVAFPGAAAVEQTPIFPAGVRVQWWRPPEQTFAWPDTTIFQSESLVEWQRMIPALGETIPPRAVVTNHWGYGGFPTKTVALVEAYYNEGWGVNFEVFKNYMPQGAVGVVPVCGGYSAQGRSDAESARIYQSLATWSGGPFPGFWMYAGESPLTPESVEVLKAWKP